VQFVYFKLTNFVKFCSSVHKLQEFKYETLFRAALTMLCSVLLLKKIPDEAIPSKKTTGFFGINFHKIFNSILLFNMSIIVSFLQLTQW